MSEMCSVYIYNFKFHIIVKWIVGQTTKFVEGK